MRRSSADSQLHWQIPFPILVAAQTNNAVDNLLSGLREHGVKALRLGADERIREDLEEHSLWNAYETHPMYQELEDLREEKDRIFSRLAGAQGIDKRRTFFNT